jgi:hypothetical protein
LTFSAFSVRLFPVSERNNNEINKMNNNEIVNPIDNGLVITDKVLVSCCGCGEELRITRDEAANWNDLDWFQCRECE